MGYKRPARVAFISTDGALAQAALRVAESDGAGWLTATAISVDAATANRTDILALIAQQDLVVSLDGAAEALLGALAPTLPTRHYGVDGLSADNQIEAVARRVKGMIAGMRMFARDSLD